MPAKKPASVPTLLNRVVSSPNSGVDMDSGEETEIAAQITMPQDGGWGWVVMMSSFTTIFIVDGTIFSYGSLLLDISKDLSVANSLAALVSSVQTALYYIGSPVASAIINRFGFRSAMMVGSIIASCSLFTTYFVTSYGGLIMFYGVVLGFGCALINMSASLVVGFYFEKLRAFALTITTSGSSCGIMAMFPVNTYLIKLADWRTVTLFHSGLFGLIFFLSMSYRSLLSLTVMQTEGEEDNPTRTVTYLPNLAEESRPRQPVAPKPNPTERLFNAVSNIHFPTASAVIGPVDPIPGQPGPSIALTKSKLALIASAPVSAISRQQLKQVQSIISRPIMQGKIKPKIQINEEVETRTYKCSCWARCCHWEKHAEESRPIYRDDIFYTGKIEDLPLYKKSVMELPLEERTGLEYQLAVTRAVTLNDLQEKKGFCTTATRRVLASMMDVSLLRKRSFIVICVSGLLTHVGLLVPYVYLSDRNLREGIDPSHCSFFISAIGFGSLIGRILFASLANKLDPVKMYGISLIFAGISTITSSISFNLYYQYFYSVAFGLCLSGMGGLRSVVFVSIYGLEKLTNATGMLLVFLGMGNLISTPTASVLKDKFGYSVSFYVAGSFLTVSGVIMLFVRPIVTRENKKAARLTTARPSIRRSVVIA